LDGFFRERLFIYGRVDDGAGHRIGHHFQQMDHGGKLAGIELVEELVRVLFVRRHDWFYFTCLRCCGKSAKRGRVCDMKVTL
jgi:hypothetical protein